MADPVARIPPTDAEKPLPFEEVLSAQRLVQESRCRLGPGADVTGVVADLRKRGIDVDRDDVVRVWDEHAERQS